MFKIFLFLPIFLFSHELYLLPDEEREFNDTLVEHVKNAKNEIYIFSMQIDYYTIIKALKTSARKNIYIFVITQDNIEKKTSYLSLFKNIYVFTLKERNRQLQGTLVCIDDKDLFLLSEELNYEKLKQNYSFALHKNQKCKKTFLTLIKRAKIY